MCMSVCYRLVALLLAGIWLFPSGHLLAGETYQAGFAKVDLTPRVPVRLTGYASRAEPFVGIDTQLFVRTLAISDSTSDSAADGTSDRATADKIKQRAQRLHLLVSIDTAGLPATLAKEITDYARREHGVGRAEIVVAATHTHTAPALVGGLTNILEKPLDAQETAASLLYRDQFMAAIKQSIDNAILLMEPAELFAGSGTASFAVNRRLLKDSKWTGFGVQESGPVDHRVDVLSLRNASGKTLGVVFNYACHCTTLAPQMNRVNADWAGYASAAVEDQFPDAVALCTIGCGGDANPDPRGEMVMAIQHGHELGQAVSDVASQDMRAIAQPIDSRFDYAALDFELPTIEELLLQVNNPDLQTRRRAEYWVEKYKEDKRLPATYPVPLQAWIFGDQLTMVFLGGEIVVDYALRLKREMPDRPLWVSAYCNDVMGYICSERMRNEGGYEFDRSAIFYNLPGPWASGTEDRMLNKIHELLEVGGRPQAKSATQSIQHFHLTDGFHIELVAAEPLITDPINIAFADDGRLWVVEMGDYPEGDPDNPNGGGRIVVLDDSDHDGQYDRATTFLDGLQFPTGVYPWNDGVVVSAAPDIFYAQDTTGDGHADRIEVLYSGFPLANTQHRINGFSYALDHSLHLAAGDNLGEVLCHKTSETINSSGHDIAIQPDAGTLDLVHGRTQYIRSNNAWGQWFGNDNSRPMYHFPIAEMYTRRNAHITYAGNSQQLFTPAVAPPVYPSRDALERFNDNFAVNRFTSACSAIVVGQPFGTSETDAVIVCEPVHQLVHRSLMTRVGASYHADRLPTETTSELLRSDDAWFRPVRAIEGPDGCVWVVDMYRESIEHPEWIPQSWQQQLDLRAGDDRGRIYRIVPDANAKVAAPAKAALTNQSITELISELQTSPRARRDLIHQRIINWCDNNSWATAAPELRKLVQNSVSPHAIVHALHLLNRSGLLTADDLTTALKCDHWGCRCVALQLAENFLENKSLLDAACELAVADDAAVAMQAALLLAADPSDNAAHALRELAIKRADDEWIATAVSTSFPLHGETIAQALVAKLLASVDGFTGADERLLIDGLRTLVAIGTPIDAVLGDSLADADAPAAFRLASIVATSDKRSSRQAPAQLVSIYKTAAAVIEDQAHEELTRCRAISLMGIGLGPIDEERKMFVSLLSPNTPLQIQLTAIDRWAKSLDAQFPHELFARWQGLSSQVREAAISHILSRPAWQVNLVDGIEAGLIKTNDLSAAHRQQLRMSGNRSLKIRVDRLFNDTNASKQLLIQSYMTYNAAEVDAKLGASLYEKNCAVCHKSIKGLTAVGPSLDNLTDRSRLNLTESILDPNRAVDPKYQTYTLALDDERILVGLIEEESSDQIVLRQANGMREAIARSNIAELKNAGVSLMPEGFEQQFSPQQLCDLIAYLNELGLNK